MTPFIHKAIEERKIGLALHYPLIHSLVVGMQARNTFEFGAGSTRVFLEAEPYLYHWSISTADRREIADAYQIGDTYSRWTHQQGKSQEGIVDPLEMGERVWFDIILHDGSHAADVVARDVAWAWPRLKRYGLLLVHDTQHSYVGKEMRDGLREGLGQIGADYSKVTIPFGFGLTVLRKESGCDEEISPAIAKIGGDHTTELYRV